MLSKSTPLAIYMPGAMLVAEGKMGFGVLRYSQNPIVAVIDPEHAGQDAADVTGIARQAPVVATLEDAAKLGAKALILGIAPPGGLIPESWYPDLESAWSQGLSLVNGLHDLLGPKFTNPVREGQFVWDIRVEPKGLGVNTGSAAKMRAKRVLMIGTDMAVGKMTAGLELWKEALSQGIKAEFVATGQIGITITGNGVPLDAIRVDYAGGSIEREMKRCAESDPDLIIIEGQGSLIHPGSTANLPLLRGSMPTHLVMCARAGQTHLARLPEVTIPDLKTLAWLYEELGAACRTFAKPRCVAAALNCAHLDERGVEEAVRTVEAKTGWPTQDPVRHGMKRVLAAIMG